jgi:hypothetical protein
MLFIRRGFGREPSPSSGSVTTGCRGWRCFTGVSPGKGGKVDTAHRVRDMPSRWMVWAEQAWCVYSNCFERGDRADEVMVLEGCEPSLTARCRPSCSLIEQDHEINTSPASRFVIECLFLRKSFCP